ncbi:hypothetical protein BS17DRAFT_777114 [Gyrodon lividus]|nr:hypothetical protein BS17DRAFT_777114 [Gyrodon lividus]
MIEAGLPVAGYSLVLMADLLLALGYRVPLQSMKHDYDIVSLHISLLVTVSAQDRLRVSNCADFQVAAHRRVCTAKGASHACG